MNGEATGDEALVEAARAYREERDAAVLEPAYRQARGSS